MRATPYCYTATGELGDVRHVMVSFGFPEKFDPPAYYRIVIEGPGGVPSFEAPSVSQPPLGSFPQSVSCGLRFMIGSDPS